MIKRITAFLTILVMIISLLPVISFAGSATSISVTADKEEATAGDIITFTITYGAISQTLGSSEFTIVVPEGLTYVAKSGSVTKNLNRKLGVEKATFTEEPYKKFISYGSSGDNGEEGDAYVEYTGYTSTEPLQIMTFQCKVNDDATEGNKQVTLNVKDFSDTDFEDIDYVVNSATVNITKKPVSATGVTLDKTSLNLKSGEKATLVATLTPEGTTDSVKSWESNNTKVATVNNGEVTAIAEGTATITVTTTNGKTATCSVTVTCAHSNKEEVAAKAPTCTEKGNNKYYKCKDCGKVFKADGVTATTVEAESIDALGHDFSINQSDATHHWQKCSRCDATTEKIQHSSDEWQTDETNHWKVCGCGVIIERGAHTAGEIKIEKEVKATCKAEGSHDEVTYCTVCNKELSRVHKVDAKTDHTAGDTVIENEIPATHTSKGSYDEVVYCKICGAEISRTKKETDMIPHDGSNVPWEADETNHWKTCGCGVIIEKAAHIAGEKVNENIVKPTCTTDGKHDEVVYCTVCKHEMSRTKDVVDKATGHNPGTAVKENVVDSTCTKEGSYDEVIYCTECKEELSRIQKTIEKKDHTAAEPVKENEVKSTIDKEGSYEEVVYCKDCHKELSRTSKTTPKFVYEVLEGKDGEHKEETTDTLTFRVNGEFSKFTDLKIDGKIVDKKYYTIKEGSTIVTLLADYLNTLTVGSHEITFVYDDAEIATNFKVAEKKGEEKPEADKQNGENESNSTNTTNKTIKKSKVSTGDNSNITLWITGLVASAILFVVVLKCTNKKHIRKH